MAGLKAALMVVKMGYLVENLVDMTAVVMD